MDPRRNVDYWDDETSLENSNGRSVYDEDDCLGKKAILMRI